MADAAQRGKLRGIRCDQHWPLLSNAGAHLGGGDRLTKSRNWRTRRAAVRPGPARGSAPGDSAIVARDHIAVLDRRHRRADPVGHVELAEDPLGLAALAVVERVRWTEAVAWAGSMLVGVTGSYWLFARLAILFA